MLLTRPANAIPVSALALYERMGYWAQVKMNGTYSQVTVRDGEVTDTRTRHDEPHKNWRLTEDSARVWRHVPQGTWVFSTELMHSKVAGIRDTHFIHDVTMADGKHMMGTSYAYRRELLTKVFGVLVRDEAPTHWVIDDNAWLARDFMPGTGYSRLFATLTRPEHEGLVLKSPTTPLTRSSTWCIKCRRPNKNLSY